MLDFGRKQMKYLKMCLAILFVMLLINTSFAIPVYADDLSNDITFSGSENGSIYVDRILYYAFKKLGYKFSIVLQDMASAAVTADSGMIDGLLLSSGGLEEKYPNLVLVNEPLSKAYYTAWTNKGSPLTITSWKDCSGKKIGVISSSPYIERHLPGDIHSKTRYAVLNDLIEALNKHEIDVAIITQFDEKVLTTPMGVTNHGAFDTSPTYTYLHKKNIKMLPALEKTLREMKSDGTIQKILNNELSLNDSTKRIVLSISSFSSDVLWERQLQDGFRAQYEEDIPFELYNVSINALRFRNDKFYRKSIANIIRRDYIDKPPAAIIVSDDEAFEFVKEYYDNLFTGTPVVFCAVNDFSPERIKGFESVFTGVAETIATNETVEQMLKMFPDTKKLFVVTDYTISGQHWRSALEKQLSVYKGTLEIEYNENLPFAELVSKVKSLEKGTLMVCGFYLVDGEGKYQMLGESQKTFFENSKVPIFGLYFPTYGQGQLGGKYSFASTHVKQVREIVKKLLLGVPVSNIPIVTDVDKDYPWYFEYETMQKFGINKNQLPKGAIITNEKPNFFVANKSGLIVATFTLAFVIIVLLIIFSRIQKKQYHLLSETQKNLHTAEEMLQKEAEISLVKEQQNTLLNRLQLDLQNVLDTLPVGVLIRRLDDFLPVYVNLSFIKMFEFHSQAEALTYNTLALSPEFQPDGGVSADIFEDNIKHIAYYDETVAIEWQYRLSDGSILDTKKVSCKIFYNGAPAIVTIIQDVTAYYKQQELLQITAEKEKEANRIKSRFVINISHEIRTPMNAIIGLSEIALMKNFDFEASEIFRKVNVSAKNLLSIINDVLDFSKIEKEKLELSDEEFILEDTLYNAALVGSKRIGNKPVEMLMNLDINMPTSVWGDKTRLWQIFKNLLDNSAKFTNAGTIFLNASCTEYLEDQEKAVLTFTVKDTGMGMSTHQVEKVFDSFEQFHQNQSNQFTGTGLGMAITKELVQLMGGTIHVESEVNIGTTTTVVIPFKLPPKGSLLKQNILNNDFSNHQIIIANETTAGLPIMVDLLATTHNTPICVSNGDDVVQLVKNAMEINKPIDMVLLNCKGGDMVGLEVAKQIRSISPETKLILVSAHASQFNPSEVFNAGFSTTMEKPFSPSEFFQKLGNALCVQQAPIVNYKQNTYAGASVLLVEDNEINQEVADSILEIFGIKPVIANNGEEAIAFLEKQHFDLVLMDLLMPVMDGHQATRFIRNSNKPYQNIPIIAMTANVVKEEISACLEEGMNGHLGKPIDINAFSTQLSKWLANFAVNDVEC